MSRIEIHLTYDENGKAYNLCNRCGTRYRYKGGSAFCKPECQTEWNKIRDATSRAEKIRRNREAKELERKREREFQSLSEEEKNLLFQKQVEQTIRNQERAEMIQEMRKRIAKEVAEKKEHEKKYGKYKNQRSINRNR